MPPTVSVVIPTYNRAQLLKKAIQSVLTQTFQAFEIIVINNYSEDNTIDVVNSLKDDRIKIINFRNNGIIAKSRNQGLKKSGGNYIAFLDDDDLWLPQKLEKQIKYLQKHPEYYLIYSIAYIIDNAGKKRGLLQSSRKREGEIFKDLVHGNFISQLTVLMRREVLENIGFFNDDPSLCAAEDYEYWLRVALQYKIGYINEPLACYRYHSENFGSKVDFALLNQRVLSLFLNNSNIPFEHKKDIEAGINELYFNRAMFSWTEPDKKIYTQKMLKKYLQHGFLQLKLTSALEAMIIYLALKVDFTYYILRKLADFRIIFLKKLQLLSLVFNTYKRRRPP